MSSFGALRAEESERAEACLNGDELLLLKVCFRIPRNKHTL